MDPNKTVMPFVIFSGNDNCDFQWHANSRQVIPFYATNNYLCWLLSLFVFNIVQSTRRKDIFSKSYR